MKKIFFFALASLALASCSQDEEFAPEKSTNGSNRANGALSFSTYTAGGTRADVVDASAVKTSGFYVNAWYDGSLYFNDGETAQKADETDNQTHEIFDTVDELYYWPSFSAGPMGFRAFNIIAGASWNVEGHSIKFAPAASASAQVDLVVAHDSVSAKPNTHLDAKGNGVQPLNFTHALSKVNFSFVGATDDKYTINKVEVIAAGKPTDGNTSTFATFTDKVTTVSTEMKQSEIITWDVKAIDGDAALVKGLADKSGSEAAQGVLYDYDFATGGSKADIVVNGKTATACDYNFMLLPQTGKIAVRVYYKVETLKKGSTTEYNLIGNCGYSKTDAQGRHNATDGVLGCKTVIIDLDGTNVPVWEAGKSYRFTLTLPDDNFIGDKSGDGVADGLDDSDPANKIDLDGDNDTDPSEFDKLTPIRFCVSVSAWETEGNTNITIK